LNKENERSSSAYMKYAGMGFQLLILIFLLLFIGGKVDAYVGLSSSIFTAILPVVGLIAYFIKIYYDLIK